MKTKWTVCYRLRSNVAKHGRYRTAWEELSKHKKRENALELERKLWHDFTDTAEFTVIEVRNAKTASC